MDSFYVTLPSNASFDVFPENKKSNFTTQFNTPIVLDGNYEVALAHITCTPNIRNDYGEIIIKNYKDQFPFLDFDLNFNFLNKQKELSLNLFDAKNLQDKINNEIKQFICFNQLLINSQIFYTLDLKGLLPFKNNQDNNLPLFYDLTKQLDDYYIPINYCDNFGDYLRGTNQPDSFTFDTRFIHINQNEVFDFIPTEFKVTFFPFLNNISEILKNLPEESIFEFINDLLIAFKQKQSNRLPDNFPLLYKTIFDSFERIYNNIILNDIQDNGLIKLNAELKDNRLKLSSNKNLKLAAKGICAEIIFKSENIFLNKYYFFSGNFNLVKHGIIYCDIIQEQIVGEAYRQVLQIITLESGENAQILSNNLDLHYVPVKKNFINNINISIKSLTGDYVKFEDDFIYSIVKLHFRKVL